MNSSEYIEVSVRLEPFSEENAEIAEAEIAELPYDSFLVEDGILKCYIQKELYNQQQLKVVLSGLVFDATFSAALVPFQNWNAGWESTFTPIVVDNTVTIKQVNDASARRTRFNISLRPEMAFGTGHHETTYMVMQAMLANESSIKGHVVLDMGCGTGVLGILAAKMGAKRTYCIDIDAVAAQSAYDNAILNRVSRRIGSYCGDASLLQAGHYDVILANIHRNILVMDMRTYAKSLRAGGRLIVSGFYEGDVEDIAAEAHANGFAMRARREKNGWCCLEFVK